MKKILPFAAVGAALLLLSKKKSSGVSGINLSSSTPGMVFIGDQPRNLKDVDFETLIQFLEECTDQNDNWTARAGAAYWLAWHASNEDKFMKYLDLASAFDFLEKVHLKDGYITSPLLSARICLTQVLDNMTREDFGVEMATRIWRSF